MTKTAILFVHGILGTPNHFVHFLPLVPKDWTIRNILLPGHGGSVKDFASSSMESWRSAVHEQVEELRKDHNRLFIVAHSMGTLFALREASLGLVDGLFLLNVPLRIGVRGTLLTTCFKIWQDKIPEEDVWTQAARTACSIQMEKNIFRYIGWIPRYVELFAEIRKSRKNVEMVQVPCEAYFSKYDEMVSLKSIKWFAGKENVHIHYLNHSGHFYYAEEDEKMFLEDFQKFIL